MNAGHRAQLVDELGEGGDDVLGQGDGSEEAHGWGDLSMARRPPRRSGDGTGKFVANPERHTAEEV